jgi:hypothetical protein
VTTGCLIADKQSDLFVGLFLHRQLPGRLGHLACNDL